VKNLTTAIMTKYTGSALATALTGGLYKAQAPQATAYPFGVYFVVSDVPDDVFQRTGEDVLLQFSLFSSSPSSSEIEDLYTALIALFDDCSLTITGTNLVWMKRENTTGASIEDHTTPTGTQDVWALHVDYRITTQVS
jgi:hypothetical protein